MAIELNRNSGLPAEGTQLYKITNAEEKASSSGDPMWVVTFTCQTASEDQGKEFNSFFPLSQAARFKVNELLDAVKAPKVGKWEARDLVGKVLKIAVQHQEYNGRPSVNTYAMMPSDSTNNPIVPKWEQKASSLPKQNSSAPKF